LYFCSCCERTTGFWFLSFVSVERDKPVSGSCITVLERGHTVFRLLYFHTVDSDKQISASCPAVFVDWNKEAFRSCIAVSEYREQ
jgi:hypothetical protein